MCSAGLIMHPAKNKPLQGPALAGHTALLQYGGALTATGSTNIGVQVEMDSAVGIRFDITFEYGTTVLSHLAFFYKFSNPYQTVNYNYLNHKITIIKNDGSVGGPDVNVVGQENIDSFPCTHLEQSNGHETQDYWMSTSVPGFLQVAKILGSIDPQLVIMAINQGIFNWGGLVKLKMRSTDPDTGQTTTLALTLIEARTGLTFPSTDFDPPSKSK
jgi:hypothetical protein